VKHQLLRLFDEAFDRKAWHGSTLSGALRGVHASQAAWRPARGAHNIWELTVHAAYWKYAVRRLLNGEARGSFALKGSNWFPRPSPSSEPHSKSSAESAWRADVGILRHEHRKLRREVAALNPATLERAAGGTKPYSTGFIVRGIAAHDLYHAGQVQLLKKLYRLKNRR
jgi:uncharacterized damage-inducible protein DinB